MIIMRIEEIYANESANFEIKNMIEETMPSNRIIERKRRTLLKRGA